MSGGPNQHYIPRLLQKHFGIKPKRKTIWLFTKDREPEEKSLKHVGSSDHFYSTPSSDGSTTLDDKITETESPLADRLNKIRNLSIGSVVNKSDASEILIHLTPRTAHFRSTMERGIRLIAEGVVNITSEEEKIKSLVGLDNDDPSDDLRQHISKAIDKHAHFSEIGIPRHVIERMAFAHCKENFSDNIAEFLPALTALLNKLIGDTSQIVREQHNNVLSQFKTFNTRKEALEKFNWRIAEAPKIGAILPDCIALSISMNGESSPIMVTAWNDEVAFVMPISSQKILIGEINGYTIPEEYDYNLEAACCSHDFFLGSTNDFSLKKLIPLIGERSTSVIEDAIDNAFSEKLGYKKQETLINDPTYPIDILQAKNETLEYELSFLNCGDAETVQPLIDSLRYIVNNLGKALPLTKLDGITVANDYKAALQMIDRGYEGASPLQTAPEKIGQGIARTVTVFREGKWKKRIVIDSGIVYGLVDNNKEKFDFSLYCIIGQLSNVATRDTFDRILPDRWMKPMGNQLQSWLYNSIDGAILAYFASHFSSGFSNSADILDGKRKLFLAALTDMKSTIPIERLSYRYHGDLDKLLNNVMPSIQYTLQFGADLLGHCMSTKINPLDDDGEILSALESAGLKNWFYIYRDQLEKLRLRYGRWNSIDEFLVLNSNVERLMWQFGLIPWLDKNAMRVEVPYGKDIAQLSEDRKSPRKMIYLAYCKILSLIRLIKNLILK